MGSIDVVMCECKTIAETVVHVSLSSKVHHHIDFLGFHDVVHKVHVGDISHEKLEITKLHDFREIVHARAVVQLIQYHKVVVRIALHKMSSDMTAYKSSPTCNQDVHRLICFVISQNLFKKMRS